MFTMVDNLKLGYALSEHPSPLYISLMICIFLYSLGDEAIKKIMKAPTQNLFGLQIAV